MKRAKKPSANPEVETSASSLPSVMDPAKTPKAPGAPQNGSPEKNVAVMSGYEPTPQEKAAFEWSGRRTASTVPLPRMSVSANGKNLDLHFDHPDRQTSCVLLAQAMGSIELNFLDGVVGLAAIASATNDGYCEGRLNFMLGAINEIKPRDAVETMLAGQMASVHVASADASRRLANAKNPQHRESVERELNRLMRTFVLQMEALDRRRSRGEPKTHVQNVSVNDGGQAVVAQVTRASPEANLSDRKPDKE